MAGLPFTLRFEKRDFSGPLLIPGVGLEVERLEWRAVGGPWSARIRARAAEPARLWQLAQLMRCGVRVADAGGPAWWGYVSAVELHSRGQVVRVALDDMWNSVGVIYKDFHPDESAGVRRSTGLYVDNDSLKTYGLKQRMFVLGQASAAEAAAYAQTMLAQVKSPLVTQAADRAADPVTTAVIECRGWWDTLDWKFSPEARGLLANTGGAGKAQRLGELAANTKIAQSISGSAETWSCSEVWLRCSRFGATDALTVGLYWDSGGAPGAAAASVSVAASGMSDELNWLRFAMPANTPIIQGAVQWIQVQRTGAVSATNYFNVAVDEYRGYAAGSMKLWNGSAWVARVPDADLIFQLVGVEEVTEQLRRLLLTGAAGQFLSGVRVETTSGIMARMAREGQERGRAVAESLLKRGTSTAGRLLARIEPDRLARIYAQPAASSAGSSAGLLVGAAGQLARMDGRPVLPSAQPAGRWAKLSELSAAGGLFGYPGAVFIEGCVWDSQGLRVVRG